MFGRAVLVGLALMSVSLNASAQDAAFYTVTYVEAAPASANSALPILKAYRDAGRKDDGALRFELLRGISRPNQFTVLGVWKDQKAYEAHAAAAHTKQMTDKISPLLAAPNDTRQHNALSVAAPQAAKGGVYAVTHVDVIPPQKDNGVAAVKQLAEDSRKHAGNLRFDAWQQTNRPNHFTVVEGWKDRKAFDAHVAAKETRDFRGKLVTMTGALYDERLYQPVE
jgi:quinol monooxygenase YgiN